MSPEGWKNSSVGDIKVSDVIKHVIKRQMCTLRVKKMFFGNVEEKLGSFGTLMSRPTE